MLNMPVRCYSASECFQVDFLEEFCSFGSMLLTCRPTAYLENRKSRGSRGESRKFLRIQGEIGENDWMLLYTCDG